MKASDQIKSAFSKIIRFTFFIIGSLLILSGGFCTLEGLRGLIAGNGNGMYSLVGLVWLFSVPSLLFGCLIFYALLKKPSGKS